MSRPSLTDANVAQVAGWLEDVLGADVMKQRWVDEDRQHVQIEIHTSSELSEEDFDPLLEENFVFSEELTGFNCHESWNCYVTIISLKV